MSLRTNAEELIEVAVAGKVAPQVASFPYEVRYDGIALVLPSVGGITYGFSVGDRVFGRFGCHVEPGASCKATDPDANRAFNLLSCVGNVAAVWSGRAEGAIGTVTGKHSVINHVLVHFKRESLEKLNIGDEIQIRAVGQGLGLQDHPDVKLMNLSPELFNRLGAMEVGGAINVPVAATIPACLMGSGIGTNAAQLGDVDVMTADREALRDAGLEDLRLGDLVAITDMSSHWGCVYEKGAVTVGVVVHGDSVVAGHGPGVTILMSARGGELRPVVTAGANIGELLSLL